MASARNPTSVKIAPGAIVCDESEIFGDVTIVNDDPLINIRGYLATRTVIHPKAKIIAEAGPIIIGENNIIEELTQIVNRTTEKGGNQTVMIIGNNNVFEVGSYVESLKIGDHNVIEAKAHVGRQVELTSGCIIGSACSITSSEVMQENTVIYGAGCSRRVQREKPPAQALQIDFLTKILPNYHYLKKPSKAATPQRT